MAGTGTPEAIAISSTTLTKTRSCRFFVADSIRRPPIISATADPPADREEIRFSEQMPMTAMTASATFQKTSNCHQVICPPCCLSFAKKAKTVMRYSAQTIPATARPNRITRRLDDFRALSWCSKKFIVRPPSE